MSKEEKILIKRPKIYKPETRIKERTLAFVDLEFSGLEVKHEIMEIGCVLVHQPNFNVVREWKVKVKPKHIENADKTSLEMIGYSESEWQDAISLEQALLEFNKIAKDAVLVGYNTAMDFSFLNKAYFDEKIKPAFHWQILDVMSMAFSMLYKKKIKGFRMTEVAEYFGIGNGKWHDALDDSRATYEIFLKLVKHG